VDAAPTPAIAVLPFIGLGPEGENAYFSEGMADELTAALTRVPGLRVASRTSAAAVTGHDLDARQIAERLGVSAVVEGSVRTVGHRIRLSARLISGADGCQLWSETYERRLDDVFALQQELARAIVGALPIPAAAGPGIGGPPATTVAAAYPLFLRGRYAARKRTVEGLSLAIEYFDQVVELDPCYAPAHVGLAECWAMRGFAEFGDLESTVAMPRARAAALEALRIDPRLAEAHTMLAVVHLLYEWDWAAADEEFRRALQLEPGNAFAHMWYAVHLSVMGRHDEAVRRVLYAETLEPLAPQIRLCVGRCYYFARRYREAIEYLEGMLEVEAGHPLTTIWLARSLCAAGRYADALEIAERLPPDRYTSYRATLTACALAGLGRIDEAREICVRVRRQFEEGRLPSSSGMRLGAPSALMGDDDAALDALEGALRHRSGHLPFLRTEPEFDRLRGNPRFTALLAELGLPES
jgi:TolB-like protein/Tfp pilus assembly protein PilF